MRISEICFCVGMMLLPFAHGSVESGTPILSLGLPFLLIPALLGVAWFMFGGGRRAELPIWFWFFLAFCGMALASCVYSAPIGPSLYRAIVNAEIAGVMLYVFKLRQERGGAVAYRDTIYLLLASGTALSFEYIGHFIYKSSFLGVGAVISDRVVGGAAALNWGATNSVAGCLLITCLMAFSLALEASGSRRKTSLLYSVFLIHVLAIGLTVSRTVLVLLLLFSFVMVVRRTGWKKSINISLLVSLLALSGFLYVDGSGDEAVQELVQNRIDVDTISSMSGRTDIFMEYVQRVLDSGGAPAGYYNSLNLNELTAHNNYLTLVYELGWIGGAIFLALVWAALWRACVSPFSLLWPVVMAAAINLAVEELIYFQVYSFYFWLLLALAYVPETRAEVVEPAGGVAEPILAMVENAKN